MERREFNKMLALGLAAGLSLPTLTRGARAANFDLRCATLWQRASYAHDRCPRAIAADLLPRAASQYLAFTVPETVLHT